jgi:hypothetical protein
MSVQDGTIIDEFQGICPDATMVTTGPARGLIALLWQDSCFAYFPFVHRPNVVGHELDGAPLVEVEDDAIRLAWTSVGGLPAIMPEVKLAFVLPTQLKAYPFA